MKILFLCGSLEPGRDGVGDYTRNLACELVKKEHETCAISIFDSFVNSTVSTFQEVGGISIPVVRVPSSSSAKERLAFVQSEIEKFNPEWLSLQYVPYSFQRKGLPFGLSSFLSKIGRTKKWHIMFHETWVGISKISPLRHKITGFFQRRLAKNIYNTLNPKVVNTSNRLYQLLLLNNKIQNSILTLFSNIPIEEVNPKFISEVFDSIDFAESARNQLVIAGIFGNIYPGANLEKAVAEQIAIARNESKKLIVLGLGRINDHGLLEFERLAAKFKGEAKFVHLKEQSSGNVSNLISIMDCSLSCTPEQHIAKSGVFAAMKLHGLKVITPASERIPEYEGEIAQFNQSLINQPASYWSVAYIAEKFISLLKLKHND
jgi:hypothetical protein